GTQLDHIFISEEIGVEKPNLGFYEKVFELLGVRDDEDKTESSAGDAARNGAGGADAASAPGIAGYIRKSDILVVGDSLTSDIRGGKNAGLKTCWYNPTHKENTRGITADLEIADLRELYDIVG
ncbi:MAG: HAD hydrolase-like protein, partial [Lachnospiraceae bacterium]|nr:HAD hydrolase-like protein [Lachnospiraceae bacterium]